MGKLGVLQSMGAQRVGHDLVTEQQCELGERGPLKSWPKPSSSLTALHLA